MQTIARANRVFPDKENGLIVDYVGVFRNLERRWRSTPPVARAVLYPWKKRPRLWTPFGRRPMTFVPSAWNAT